jgi:ankyrin repeat protein
MLDAGADVNVRVDDGSTPLHTAATYNENPEVITVLLDAGVDGTAVNEDGKTSCLSPLKPCHCL